MSEQNPEAMAAEAAQKSAEANVHYMAMKYYCDKEMPVFVDDDKGRQDTIEKAFVAGAEWQKSRAQQKPPMEAEAEINELEAQGCIDDERIAHLANKAQTTEIENGKLLDRAIAAENGYKFCKEKVAALEAELEEKCEALRDALKSNQEYARVIDMLKNQDTLDTKNGVPFDAADEASYQIKIAELEERLAEAERILKAVSKYGPQQGTISQSACAFCDMGGAGYASRGDGFHDDSCAVKDAQVFLAKHPSPARGEGVE